VSLVAVTAVTDLPVIHLNLAMQWGLGPDGAQKVLQSFNGLTALRSIHLQVIDIDLPSHALPAAVRTFLQSAPELEELAINTARDLLGFSNIANAPASSLFSGHDASRLRSLSIEGPTYTVDKALASHIDLGSLKRLVLPHQSIPDGPMVEEDFWLIFAEMARRSGGLGLKHLSCPRLSPGLINFLSSFSTLQELHFSSGFYPNLFSLSGKTGLDSTLSKSKTEHAERQLVDVFFKTVFSTHKNSLRSLALCGRVALDEPWNPSKEYLQSMLACRALKYMHVPLRYAVDNLVSASEWSCRVCPSLTPMTPYSGRAGRLMHVVVSQSPHVEPLPLPLQSTERV